MRSHNQHQDPRQTWVYCTLRNIIPVLASGGELKNLAPLAVFSIFSAIGKPSGAQFIDDSYEYLSNFVERNVPWLLAQPIYLVLISLRKLFKTLHHGAKVGQLAAMVFMVYARFVSTLVSLVGGTMITEATRYVLSQRDWAEVDIVNIQALFLVLFEAGFIDRSEYLKSLDLKWKEGIDSVGTEIHNVLARCLSEPPNTPERGLKSTPNGKSTVSSENKLGDTTTEKPRNSPSDKVRKKLPKSKKESIDPLDQKRLKPANDAPPVATPSAPEKTLGSISDEISEALHYAGVAYEKNKKALLNTTTESIGRLKKDWLPISAYAYKDSSKNRVYITFKGTSSFTQAFFDDFIGLGLCGKPLTASAATRDWIQKIISEHPDSDIVFTGHSLGAALATWASSIFHKVAWVFENPGLSVDGDYSQVTSLNITDSSIAGINTHQGNIITLPPRSSGWGVKFSLFGTDFVESIKSLRMHKMDFIYDSWRRFGNLLSGESTNDSLLAIPRENSEFLYDNDVARVFREVLKMGASPSP